MKKFLVPVICTVIGLVAGVIARDLMIPKAKAEPKAEVKVEAPKAVEVPKVEAPKAPEAPKAK